MKLISNRRFLTASKNNLPPPLPFASNRNFQSVAAGIHKSILNLRALSEYRICANPAVYSSAIVADLKPRALNRFYQMQIFAAADLTQNYVAFLQPGKIRNRLDRAKLTRFDFAFHRMPARAELNRFAVFQFRDVRRCPTHLYLNCSKNLTSFSNIKRMSSSEYIKLHILSRPKPKAKPE